MKTFYVFVIFNVFYSGFCQIQFTNMAQSSGLNNTEFGFGTLGAGISFYDFNQDGLDDISMATASPQNLRFFENNGNGFTEILINGINAPFENKSVVWVDYDNDGDLDLYVTNHLNSNHLYNNDGDFNFTEVSQSAGLTENTLESWGASWADYDKDSDLDLLILHRDAEEYNILYQNNGDGTFTDVTETAGLSMEGHFSFCAAFFDFDNDGWLDIYVANDKNDYSNLLYKNNGDGTFTDVSAISQSDVNIDAMSTAIGDYNKDGYFDIYITNTFAGNVFLNNNGDGTFTDVAAENNTSFNSVGWGSVFFDADMDTDLDLYVSGGLNGSQGNASAAFYEQITTSNFTELPEAMPSDTANSFSNALGDYDNDGKPDVGVLNFSPNDLFLWHNTTPTTSNWAKIKLKGTESNSMAIGATIELTPENSTTQYQVVLCSEGYLAQNSAYEFFGLGDAQNIESVTIKWPNGLIETYQDLQVNSAYTIEEGFGILNTEIFELNEPIVSPNPATSYINIKSKKPVELLNIYSLQGKLIFQNRYNQSDFNLNLEQLSNGIYILELAGKTQVFKQKLIIKR